MQEVLPSGIEEESKGEEEEIKRVKEEEEEKIMAKSQKTVDEIEQIKSEYNFNIEAKHLEPKANLILYNEETKPVNKIFRTTNTKEDQRFVLKPNPIMRLDRVVGMHPRFQASQIFYNKDPKLTKEIVYC